jgi:hypothetical protein
MLGRMTRSSIWDVDRDRFDEPPLRLIPRGVCTHCRRFDYCPLSLPTRCYWCGAGEFVFRGDTFRFEWCPACDGRDFFCKACHGTRIIAIPIATEPRASATPSGS